MSGAWSNEIDALTDELLREFETIVVVGLSSNPDKVAHSVPAAMQRFGWRVIPVNPYGGSTLLGEVVYPDLASVPPELVGLVNVFRPAADCPAIARDAVAAGAKALWLQQEIISAEARAIAHDAGLRYVEDRCIGVERARHGIRRN